MEKTLIKSCVTEKILLTENVIEFHLKKPPSFVYTAGQFIQLHVPDGEKTVLRSYSLSSSPHDPDLELCVKIIPSGKASAYLGHVSPGDSLVFDGPQGRFTHPTDPIPLVCIATGAGIAPIMSIVSDELAFKKNESPIELIFGVRSEADIFWLERLETLQRDYNNFHYTLTLSQPTPTWDSHRGRVTAHLPLQTTNKKFYICGSPQMIMDVRKILLERKADAKTIYFEAF